MSGTDDALRLRRFGTLEAPAPLRLLSAGRLAASFDGTGLRAIRFAGHEVLRAVAYVVRDRDWGTIAPDISDLAIEETADRFRICYRARALSRDGSGAVLDWRAEIAGRADGTLLFSVEAVPTGEFVTARSGFAVLHPLRGVTGAPITVEHVDGTVEQARFPDLIEPWQPFKDIRAITHRPASGLVARTTLEGGVFEMEDQRAWSDASFKTYIRPLSLPWPYMLPAGVANRQSVSLAIEAPGSIAEAREPAMVALSVGERTGLMPPIGVALDAAQAAEADLGPLLGALSPQALLFGLDPTKGEGFEALRRFASLADTPEAARARVTLEVAVACARPLDEELGQLAAEVRRAGLRLDALMVSPAVDRQSTPPGSAWPSCPPLAELYQAARRAFPDVLLGGGMLSMFTELNRKRPPFELLDFVSHTLSPIVHAADDVSVMQTLEAVPDIVRSVRAMIGDRPYRIGPCTIGMRHNPYGSRLLPNPDRVRMTMSDRDPRQRGLFAASWTIGTVAATEGADLDLLVPAFLAGTLGLAERNGSGWTRHPVFHVVRALAGFAGRARRSVVVDAPSRVAAVACDDERGGTILILANLSGEPQTVSIAGAPDPTVMLRIDDDGEMNVEEERRAPLPLLGPYAVLGLRLR